MKLKTLGIIGGMSPESTVSYYQCINREINARLGGNHSADIVMHSLEFEPIVRMQRAGDWAQAGEVLAQSARRLESVGAQALVLATNTMHKVADTVQNAVGIPLLHIVDAVADALRIEGLHTAALLGTRFTMCDGFYTDRLRLRGVHALVPDAAQQDEIDRVIFEELCRNRLTAEARAFFQSVLAGLQAKGAQAVIFGCTEIGLLLRPEECLLPVFDSARIHALAAVTFILEGYV